MRNWDPLSIFKYLTGSPTMHLVMLINYAYTDPLEETDENAFNFEAKSDLIERMYLAHLVAAIAFFIFESGMIEFCCMKNPSIMVPSFSLFIQIVCYQGIVFEEINFLMYREFPYMSFDGPKGLFAQFERWDILIMLDIVLFLSNLLTIIIFCIGSVYPGEFIMKDLHESDLQHIKRKDYMECAIDWKKLVLQINSLAIANSIYLFMIYSDSFQQDLNLQWFVLFCDWCFLLGIYRSTTTAQFTIFLLMLRYLVVLIWGAAMYFTLDTEQTPEYKVAYIICFFMLVDGLILFPLQFMRLVCQILRKEQSQKSKDDHDEFSKSLSFKGFGNIQDKPEGQEGETKDEPKESSEIEMKEDQEVKEPAIKMKQLSVEKSIYSLAFASMVTPVSKLYALDDFVNDYFFKATMIFFIQMIIISFVFLAAITETDGLDYVQPTTRSLTLRLLCCYLFHLSNYGDVADSFRRLKFLKENPDKFAPGYVMPAFILTQFQFFASFSCEAVNILFVTRQTTLIDLMMNYVAFEGISAMDNLYVETIRNMEVTKAVPIEGTENKELEEALSYQQARRDYPFSKPFYNDSVLYHYFMKFVHIWFVIIKVLYKGIYFYIFPYLIIPLSYYVFDFTKIEK